LEHLKALSRLGAGILALDYRGYGKSEGSPEEAGLYRDADAAYRYLGEQRKVDPRSIVIYGHSLGGAVAVDLASRHECGGLIVESSFTSGREMARRMFLIPFLEYVPRTRYDSILKIPRVRAPILIVHGTRDEVIPFEMGKKLFEAAPEPKFFFPVPGGGHDDILEKGGEAYWRQLTEFLGRSS